MKNTAAKSAGPGRLLKAAAWASLLPAATLVISGLLAWHGALDNGFVYDDEALIVGNEAIRSLHPLSKFFRPESQSSDPRMTRCIWRPATIFLYAVNYRFWRLNPYPYHLTSVSLHVLNALLVWLLALMLFAAFDSRGDPRGPPFAFAAALVFLLHPVQTESVAWVSGLANPLFTFFFLSSWILFARRQGQGSASCASLVCFVVSMLCKEAAVVLPAVLLLYVFLTGTRRYRLLVPYFLLAGGFVALRSCVLGQTAQTGYWAGGLVPQALTMLKGFAYYVKLTLWPRPLSLEYLFEAKRGLDMEVLLCGLLLAGLLIYGVRQLRRNPRVGFGVMLFFIALAPVSNLIPITTIINERFLYLAVIGWGLLVGEAVSRSLAIRAACLAALAVLYSLGTAGRNLDWRDARSLVTESLRTCPQSARLHFAMGNVHAAARQWESAVLEYRLALAIDLGEGEEMAGFDRDEALSALASEYRRGIQVRIDRGQALFNIGSSCLKAGAAAKAAGYLELAKGLNPLDVGVRNNLAAAYAAAGDPERAVLELEAFLSDRPGELAVARNLELFRRQADGRFVGRMRRSFPVMEEKLNSSGDFTGFGASFGPYTVNLGGLEVGVRPVGAREVPARLSEGVLRYPGAYPGTDVFFTAGAGQVEQFYYLGSPGASRRFVTELSPRGRVASFRLGPLGDLEALDHGGGKVLNLSRPVAFDSSGRRREGRYELEGTLLALSFDDAGLEYPLLIDPVWTTAGASNMSTARSGASITLLPNGKVLVAGGSNGNDLSTAELYDPITGSWAMTGGMDKARNGHSATLLPNGKVLVAGGGTGFSSTELYDPAGGSWSAINSMQDTRIYHSATLLPNGKVLVAGGNNGSGPLSKAEIYDPSSGLWSATNNNMTAPRNSHSATLLSNGKVLVTGGGNYLSSAEIFDPDTGNWTSASPMPLSRCWHSSIKLPNGRVLVIGGESSPGSFTNQVHLYDPVIDAWTSAASMSVGRDQLTVTLLPNGKILATGGRSGVFSCNNSTEIFDYDANVWSPGGAISVARCAHGATMLPNGKVLIVGGTSSGSVTSSAELYVPTAGNWTSEVSMADSRSDHIALVLPNGKVLVAGGYGGGTVRSTAELFDPAVENWSTTGSMNVRRKSFVSVLMPNGKILVAGGTDGSNYLRDAEIYDPLSGVWARTSPMFVGRAEFSATLLPSGKVLVGGGSTSSGGVAASAELYDPVSGTWAMANPMSTARKTHVAALLENGKVLVAGGDNGSDLKSAELYDPVAGTWKPAGDMTSFRRRPSVALLPNGKVLVLGGASGGTYLNTAEIFDPSSNSWTTTSSLSYGREDSSVSALPDGRVLVAGGYNWGCLNSVELYDPAAGSWRNLNAMSGGKRLQASMSLMPNGKVLVAGGGNCTTQVQSAETISFTEYDYQISTKAYMKPKIESIAGSSSFPVFLTSGTYTITGTTFTGAGEGSGGNVGTAYSAGNLPRLYAMAFNMDGAPGTEMTGRVVDLTTSVYGSTNQGYFEAKLSAGKMDFTIPSGFQCGYYQMFVAANAVQSDFKQVCILPPPPLQAPTATSPAFLDVRTTTVAVQWTPTGESGVEGYLVEASSYSDYSQGEAYGFTPWAGLSSASVYGLWPNTTYYFRAAAENCNSSGPYSGTLGSTSTLANPAGNLAFAAIFASSATVNWVPLPAAAQAGSSGTAEGYWLQASTASDFSGAVFSSSTVNPQLSTLTVQGLSANATWYFRVGSVNWVGVPNFGPASSTVTAVETPTSIFFDEISTGSITASAYAPPPAFGNLDQGQSGTRMAKDGSWDSWLAAAQHPFNGLLPNKLYAFKAKARNSIGVETAESPEISTYTLAAAATSQNGPVFQGVFASSLAVNWSSGTAEGGFNGPGATYLVVASTMETFIPVEASSLTANTTAVLSGVQPNATHFLRLQAYNTGGMTDYSWLNLGSTVTLSLAPGILADGFPGVFETSAAVRWAALAAFPSSMSASGYRLEASSSVSGAVYSSATPNVLLDSLTLDLERNTTYHFRVASLNRRGDANYSVIGATATLAAQPNNPALSGVFVSSMTVSWEPSVSEGVLVEASSGGAVVSSQTLSPSLDRLSLLGLMANATYHLRVANLNWAGAASYKSLGSTPTLANEPLPSAVPFASLTQSSVEARWLDNGNSPGTRYEALLSTEEAPSGPVSASTDPTASFSGLGSNTTYHLFARAVNRAGIPTGYASLGSTATLAAAPVEALVPFEGVSTGSMVVYWGSNGNSTGTLYRAALSTSPSGPGDLSVTTRCFSNPSAAFTGLLADTSYYLFVAAFNHSGAPTAFSALQSTTTPANAPSPSSPVFVEVSSFSLSVRWDSNGNGPGTLYEAALNGASRFAASTAAWLGSLSPNTTYSLAVRTIARDGRASPFADLGSTSTLAALPVISTPSFADVGEGALTGLWGTSGNPPSLTTYTVVLDAGIFMDTAPAAGAASFNGLVPNTTYFLQVRARNHNGLSTEIVPAGSTSTLSKAPSTASFAEVTAFSMSVSFDSHGNPLERTTYTLLAGGVSLSTLSLSATLAGLTPNTTYPLSIYSTNHNGIPSPAASLGSTVTLAAVPLGLPSTFTVADPGSLGLRWDSHSNPLGLTTYTVQASTLSDFSSAMSVSTISCSATLEGLVRNATYYARVRARNWSGTETEFASLGSTSTLAAAPAWAAFAGVSTASLSAQWDSNGNTPSTLYRAVLSTSPGGVAAVEADTRSPAAAFTGLLSDASYYLLVQAVNNDGIPSAFASLGSTLTLLSAPAPAASPFASVSSASIAVRWLANNNGPGTRYEAALTGGFSSLAASTSALMSGLTPNTTYSLSVRTLGRDASSSSFVSMGSTSTLSAVPLSPAAAFLSMGETRASLLWDGNGNPLGRTTYTVQASTAADFSLYSEMVSSGPEAAFEGLAPNATHYFQVRSVNHNGIPSAFAVLGATATLSRPPAAAAFTAVSSAALGVSFDANGNPLRRTTYTVVLSTASSYPNSLPGNLLLTTCSEQAEVRGLAPNATYYLFIRSVNPNGVPSAFAALGSTASWAAPPMPPSGSTFTAVGVSSVALAWGANGNPPETEYLAEAGPFQSGWQASTAAVFLGLSTNTLYACRVKARNKALIETDFTPLGSTPTLAAAPESGALAAFVSSASAQWQGSNPAWTEHRVAASTSPGFDSAASSSAWAASVAASVSGLLSDTTYYFRVRARNLAGVESAPLDLGRAATRVCPPASGSIVEAGPYGVSLAWDPGTNPVGRSLGPWTASTPLPEPRERHAMAASGDRLFVSGGVDGGARASVWGASLSTGGTAGAWSGLAPLPAPRESHAMVAWAGRLYAIGGFDADAKSTVWWAPIRQDGGLGEWTQTSSLPAPRYRHAAAVHRGRVFVAGGSNGIVSQASVYCADVLADGGLGPWRAAASLPAARSGLALAVSSGALYASGGVGAGVEAAAWRASLESGEPASWSEAQALPEPLTAHSMSGSGNRLFVLGGWSGAPVSTVWIAGPSGWESAPALPAGIHSHAGLEWNGFLIVAGGSDGNSASPAVLSAPLLGTAYEAEWSLDGVHFTTSPWASRGGLKVSGLTPNATCYARVKARGGDFVETPYLNLGSTLTAASLPGVDASTWADVQAGSIAVAWALGDNPSGTEFRVRASTSALFDSGVIESGWLSALTTGFLGLGANTSHYFRVQARNSASLEGPFAPLGSRCTLSLPPSQTEFSAVETTGLALRWSANGNPSWTLYEAQVSTSAGFEPVAASSATRSTSAAFGGLLSATTFYARVRSINGNGVLSPFDSAVSTATGLDLVPPAKSTSAAAFPGDPARSVLFQWISAGDDGYSGDLIAGSQYAVEWTTGDPAAAAWSTAAAQARVQVVSASPGSLRSATLTGLPEMGTAFLRVWTMDEAGNWSVPSDAFSSFVSPFALQTVDGAGIDAGYGASLAAGRSGAVHASYRAGTSSLELRYARRLSGSWSLVESPDPGTRVGATAIAVDGGGNPAILYRDSQSGALKLASRSGSWSVSTLESGDIVPGGLAFGPSGRANAAYLDAASGIVKFSSGTGSAVEAGSSSPSLALDGAGLPHLAYASGPSVRYASAAASGWSLSTVDSGRPSAIALDGEGRPRILYRGAGSAKLAAWTGASWSTQTIEGGVQETGALVLDGDGRPHAVYRAGGLKYAQWTGSAWSTMTVDSRGEAGGFSSLALGPSGEETLAHYEASGRDLRSAYRPAGLSPPVCVQAPSSFAGAAASTGSIQWSWIDESVNEAGFRLYGSTSPDGPFELVAGTQALAASPGTGYLRTFLERGLQEGATYYRYAAAVNAGGAAASAAAGVFPYQTVDRTSPTITVNFEGDGIWRRANARTYDVDFADLGGSGLRMYSVKASTVPGGAGPDLFGWVDTALSSDTYTDDWALGAAVFDALMNGATNYLSVRAVDGMGNAAVRTDAFVVLKDSSPPVLSNSQAGDLSVRASSGTRYSVFAFDAASGLSSFQYSASLTRYSGDASLKPWTGVAGLAPGSTSFASPWEIDFASLASNATNFVSVRAVDRAGSTATLVDAFFVLKDTAGPVAAILSPQNAFRSSLASITGTASDPSGVSGVSVRIRENPPAGNYWNGTSFGSASEVWLAASGTSSWSLGAGASWVDQTTYSVVARASDALGNYSAVYATAVFAWDSAAPSVSVTAPAPGSTVSALASVFGTADDPGATKSGVAFVDLSLRRIKDGKYWNFYAEAFSDAEVSTRASGASSWSFSPSQWLKAGLADQTSYFLAVRAVDAAVPANSGNFSQGSTFTFSDTTPPGAIADLSGSSYAASPASLRLSWTAPGDDGGSGIVLLGEYRIQYSTDPAARFSTASAQVAFSTASVVPGSPQERILTGLRALATYYARVFLADDAGNWSPLSNGATVQASDQPHSSISGRVLKVSSEGITAVFVSCFDASNSLVVSTYTVDDGSGSFTLEGLGPGGYKVQAAWTIGSMASSVVLDNVSMGTTDLEFVLNLGYSLATLTGTIEVFPSAAARPGFLAAAAAARYLGSAVELFVDGRAALRAPVGPGGRWTISHLLPGKYGVRAFNGLEWTEVQEVEVGEGETKAVAFLSDPLPRDKVFAFPNPARDQAVIRFYTELSPLEAQVLIFDLSGALVREIPGSDIVYSGSWVYHAGWDLKNSRGEPVASGVYLFMVKVRGGAGQSAKAVKKLAVIK